MKKNLALAALLAAATAGAQSVTTVVQEQQHRVESIDARVSGRLVLVDAAGKRTTYKCSVKTHGFADGVRLLDEVDSPQPVRILAHLDNRGRITLRIAHKNAGGKWQPADATPPRLTDPLAGSGLTLEDLLENQFFWKDQALAGHGTCGTRACVTLKSTSASADRTQYATVVSSSDEKTGALLHVVKTERAGGVVKDFTYSGLRQSHGVTSATQIELKIAGQPGSTLFIIDRGTAKANLSRSDFDLDSATLEDPVP
jgi:hypothetical protein